MKMITKTTLATLVALGLSFNASALLITPATSAVLTGNDTSQSVIDGILATHFADCDDFAEVYKQDVDENSDSGTFAGSYSTEFFNEQNDPEDATISYVDGATAIDSDEIFLLVKDGNQTPAWYLFDISSWNGTDDIVLEDFWVGSGAISHVTLYTCSSTPVPDGGATAMLLGVAMLGLGGLKRVFRG